MAAFWRRLLASHGINRLTPLARSRDSRRDPGARGSFAHSHFLVDIERPHELVAFLRSIMPRKRVAELYISLGYHKHGKTELYRDLLQCLDSSGERFLSAPCEPGMVMLVFTLPGYDLVVKVIRDRFAEPKTVTRGGVISKYRLVFRHDRAGRLADAQEFEHLHFPRERFDPALVGELLRDATEAVAVHDDRVVIRHAYIERRVMPLDLFLKQTDPEVVQEAAIRFRLCHQGSRAEQHLSG